MTGLVVKVCRQGLFSRLSSRLLSRLLSLNHLTHEVCQIFILFLIRTAILCKPLCMVLSPCGLRLATKCSERLKHTEFHSETGEGIISSWPPQPPDRGKQNFRKHHLFQALFILEMFSRVKKDKDCFFLILTSYCGVTSGNEHRNDNWSEMVR